MLDKIKELRSTTGVSIALCKEALENSNMDTQEAITYLRKKGEAGVQDRAMKTASDGVIGSYVHMGGRIASIVELRSETDFVSRHPTFQQFAHNLALQVVASRPLWVSRYEVPNDIVEKEVEIARVNIPNNKPYEIVAKIISGRLDKFYKEVCLVDQTFVVQDNLSVEEKLNELRVLFKENIYIKRFSRFEVGQ